MNEVDVIKKSNFDYGLYSVKDVQLDYFAPPFVAASDLEACALVRNSIEKGSTLYVHSSLFALYRVGTFDFKKGIFSSLNTSDRYFLSTIDNLLSSDMYSHDETE